MVKAKLLIDTDVMIEYLRGTEAAIAFLESLEQRPATSVICVAELLAGIRDEQERKALEQFLLAFDKLSVDEEIAQLGGQYRRTYMRSHNTGLADALIAATANKHRLLLTTFNARHYPMFEELLVPYQRS